LTGEVTANPREEASAAMRDGSPARAVAVLTDGARQARSRDRDDAARLLVEAVPPAFLAYGPSRAIDVARDAVQLASASHTGVIAMLARARLGDALSWGGRYPEAAVEWEAAAELTAETTLEVLAERASILLRLGRLDEGREAAYRVAQEARRLDDVAGLHDALGLVLVAETDAGRLREALRAGEEALAIATEPTGDRLDALGAVAWSEALLGLEPECRSHLDQARALGEALRLSAPGGFAEGLLELSLGHYAEAVRLFEAKAVENRLPAAASALRMRRFADALVEALVRAGRQGDAASVLAGWFDAAVGSGQPRFASVAYRCRGLVEDDAEAFERALDWHGRWSNAFERARTELCFGETLRRRRRRREAREQLRRANERFEQVGAVIWGGRARAELAATGERARRRTPEAGGDLTPQERHVAALAARGLTNKEIAAQLVLSPKTIETHLRHVFQKLGVNTRTELASQFRDLPDSSGALPS
jgi:DNA-binding CsgD family transcriptional regulator